MPETYEHLEQRCNRYGCEIERLKKQIKEFETENKQLKDFLREKSAIAKASADNDNYCVNITIAEIEQVLKGKR